MASMLTLTRSSPIQSAVMNQRMVRYHHYRSIFSLVLRHPQQKRRHSQSPQGLQYRHYIPLTEEEEKAEKTRVKSLSDFSKEQELRKLNREIARLEMLKGINTGELYTWSGRYKALARDYGMPLLVWYWGVWGFTFIGSYFVIDFGGVDVIQIMMKLDTWTGWDISGNVKPEYGKFGLALVFNEILEPVRLPVVIMTVKPVMDQLFPPKY